MASTITLQRTINFAQTFSSLQPLTGVGGFTNEPAFSIGDWVRQFILAPPFAWRFNRLTTTISINNTTQDYPQGGLSAFGWIEKASITDGGTLMKELEISNTLQVDGTQNEPTHLSVFKDNGAGTITFRVFPNPDKNYTMYITYQQSAPIFANLTDTWSPIPDYYSYLYNQGFLAKVYEKSGDERFPITMTTFFKQVVAANSGLSESQINLFMDDKIRTQREIQDRLGNAQSGRAGRSGMLNQ